MERKVNKLEHSHVEVLVTVDEKTWKDAQNKSFKKLAANVTVPGFRKGKAPENMLKGRVDPMKVMDDAINALLPTLYKDILDNEAIQPYTQPKVDVTKLSDKELEVKFLIVTAPEIALGEYKGLKVGKKAVKVLKADVDKAVEDLLKQNATLVVKEDAAALGDTVVIDFVGSVDGVPFEGGAAEGHELELGSGSFIPGFEDQLVGIKAGDKKDINVKFPENYTPELKGKDALFAITCHEVKAKNLPVLDEAFIKDLKLAGVENEEQLREYKKNELKNQKEAQARSEYLNALVAKIAGGSKIDIPDEIIDQQVASRKEDTRKRVEQSGLTLEQYLSILGQKEEDFLAQLKDVSVKDFSSYLVMNQVGMAEKIEVTEADVEFELAKLAEQYKMQLEDVKKALANQMGEYRYNLRMQKIEEFLYSNND